MDLVENLAHPRIFISPRLLPNSAIFLVMLEIIIMPGMVLVLMIARSSGEQLKMVFFIVRMKFPTLPIAFLYLIMIIQSQQTAQNLLELAHLAISFGKILPAIKPVQIDSLLTSMQLAIHLVAWEMLRIQMAVVDHLVR